MSAFRPDALTKTLVVRLFVLPEHAYSGLALSLFLVDAQVAPSSLYGAACVLEGVPFINGAPQNTLVPGLIELAVQRNVLIGGDDFKSGQTKLKSVLVQCSCPPPPPPPPPPPGVLYMPPTTHPVLYFVCLCRPSRNLNIKSRNRVWNQGLSLGDRSSTLFIPFSQALQLLRCYLAIAGASCTAGFSPHDILQASLCSLEAIATYINVLCYGIHSVEYRCQNQRVYSQGCCSGCLVICIPFQTEHPCCSWACKDGFVDGHGRSCSGSWVRTQVDFLVGAGFKPTSIVSYNHLGNNDGMNLSAPQTFRSKEISKSNVVDDVVASNSILYGPGNVSSRAGANKGGDMNRPSNTFSQKTTMTMRTTTQTLQTRFECTSQQIKGI